MLCISSSTHIFCDDRSRVAPSQTVYFHKQLVYLTVLDPIQYKYQRSFFFFLNYSIKCCTHILACSSYDLIRNMMLRLVCQSRPTGAAHLVRKKNTAWLHYLESYQKGAAKANSNEPYCRRPPSFCIILNDSSMKKNPKHAYLPTEESRQRRGGGVTVLNPYKSTRFHCVTKQPVVSRIQSPIYRWS